MQKPVMPFNVLHYRSGGVGPLTDYMDMDMETTPRGSEQSVHEPLLLFIPIVHLLPKARPKHRDAKVPGGNSILCSTRMRRAGL